MQIELLTLIQRAAHEVSTTSR